MSEHTDEPWVFDSRPRALAIYAEEDADREVPCFDQVDNIYYRFEPSEQERADAKRIVNCVNACEGIPTEVLEREDGIHGVIADALLRISAKATSVQTDPRVATAILRQTLHELGMGTWGIDALLNRRAKDGEMGEGEQEYDVSFNVRHGLKLGPGTHYVPSQGDVLDLTVVDVDTDEHIESGIIRIRDVVKIQSDPDVYRIAADYAEEGQR